MDHQQAKKRIKELKGYYAHVASFVSVNLFLFTIYLLNYDGSAWFVYPLFGWGIGLAVHTFQVFGTSGQWETRKMEELTGWKTTKDELDRLSERTETLISILSSVDWDKIDPDLVQSRDNLQNAKQKISEMHASSRANPDHKAEVVREIEKLEEFVTSSKFKYYDQAASDQSR